MILKSSYQQVVIVVDRDELADMLLGQPRFEIEKIEDKHGVSADPLYGFGQIILQNLLPALRPGA